METHKCDLCHREEAVTGLRLCEPCADAVYRLLRITGGLKVTANISGDFVPLEPRNSNNVPTESSLTPIYETGVDRHWRELHYEMLGLGAKA
jgi:hypothetical protein